MSRDIRTIDKLVNTENETYEDKNLWLAPFINPHFGEKELDLLNKFKQNIIYIYFEKPIIISAINIWNYTKTPSRGVREFEISLDDKIIY